MKKLILLDGNGLIFRAYYATATRMTRSTNGVPTNAIYLFANIIMKLLERHEFDDFIVALDSPGKKFRHKEYNNYKANRKELPVELTQQFGPIRDFLNICNIKTIEIPGYEADDIIGTISSNAKKLDLHVEVYTGDRDLLQLINDNTIINMMHKGLSEVEPFDKEHLKEVYNLTPRQIIDLKSLMGDSSDNIPGVKGVGEKTALDLILKYESLSNIYEHIDEIKGKLQEKLINDKDMAFLSYDLATIDTNVNMDLSIAKGTYDGYDAVGLNKFFKLYNIKSLLKYTKESEEVDFKIKTDVVNKISSDLLVDNSLIYVDVDNENYHYGTVRGLAIASKNKVEYIYSDMILFDHDLIDYLQNNKISKDVYDSKLAYIALNKLGIKFENIGCDVLLASYLLNPDLKTKEDIYNKYGINFNAIARNSSSDDICIYCQNIAAASVLIKDKMLEEISLIENKDLLFKIEQPLAIILAKMELNGVLIDTELLNKLDNDYTQTLNIIEKEIYDLAGCEVNINSPKQLAELLYDKLSLPCNKKRSTGADDLKYIESMHPVVSKILQYRKFSKLLNTYIDSFKAYKFNDDRIHAMFNQATTMTGRLSSSQPNLQNLSIRDDDRMIIRKLVIAPKGYKILSLDYSQIELRLLAIMSNDSNMLEAFASNIDIHTVTASKIFNVDIDKVSNAQRRISKAVNFGIVYGISAWGLSEQIGVSMEESKNIINKFFMTYPKVKEYLDHNIEFCSKNGYVTTMFNRRRTVNEINSSNYNIKEFGKRVAMNSPIQGSAADIIKKAMIEVDKYISTFKDDCKLICQIHDELLFEVKEQIANEVMENVKNIMENVIENQHIKLKVSYAIGNNWLEAK